MDCTLCCAFLAQVINVFAASRLCICKCFIFACNFFSTGLGKGWFSTVSSVTAQHNVHGQLSCSLKFTSFMYPRNPTPWESHGAAAQSGNLCRDHREPNPRCSIRSLTIPDQATKAGRRESFPARITGRRSTSRRFIVNVNLSRDVVRTVFNDVDLTKFGQFSRIGCFEAHRLFVIHFHVRTGRRLAKSRLLWETCPWWRRTYQIYVDNCFHFFIHSLLLQAASDIVQDVSVSVSTSSSSSRFPKATV